MSTSTHTLRKRNIEHSRHDHKDGGQLADYTKSRSLFQCYLKANETEWSGDFALDDWASKSRFRFTQLDLGLGNGFGFNTKTCQELNGDEWKNSLISLTDFLSWYWQGQGENRRHWYGPKGKEVSGVMLLTATMRPDHALTLELAGQPQETKTLLKSVATALNRSVDDWIVGGPTANLIECHLGESVPHFHCQAEIIRDGELLWPNDGPRKRGDHGGFGNLGPAVVVMLRLVKAGLYIDDPFARRAYDEFKATKGREPLDWTQAQIIDDMLDAHLATRPELLDTHKQIYADYKLWISAKIESSPFNHRAKMAKLKRELEEKDVRLSALET